MTDPGPVHSVGSRAPAARPPSPRELPGRPPLRPGQRRRRPRRRRPRRPRGRWGSPRAWCWAWLAGKLVGILGLRWVAVRSAVGRPPEGVLAPLVGISAVAGSASPSPCSSPSWPSRGPTWDRRRSASWWRRPRHGRRRPAALWAGRGPASPSRAAAPAAEARCTGGRPPPPGDRRVPGSGRRHPRRRRPRGHVPARGGHARRLAAPPGRGTARPAGRRGRLPGRPRGRASSARPVGQPPRPPPLPGRRHRRRPRRPGLHTDEQRRSHPRHHDRPARLGDRRGRRAPRRRGAARPLRLRRPPRPAGRVPVPPRPRLQARLARRAFDVHHGHADRRPPRPRRPSAGTPTSGCPAPPGETGVWPCPAGVHLLSTTAGCPTGASEPEEAESDPIAGRTFDDLYALGRHARCSRWKLEDGGSASPTRTGTRSPRSSPRRARDFACTGADDRAHQHAGHGRIPLVVTGRIVDELHRSVRGSP